MNGFDVAERYVIELCCSDEGVACKLHAGVGYVRY